MKRKLLQHIKINEANASFIFITGYRKIMPMLFHVR